MLYARHATRQQPHISKLGARMWTGAGMCGGLLHIVHIYAGYWMQFNDERCFLDGVRVANDVDNDKTLLWGTTKRFPQSCRGVIAIERCDRNGYGWCVFVCVIGIKFVCVYRDSIVGEENVHMYNMRLETTAREVSQNRRGVGNWNNWLESHSFLFNWSTNRMCMSTNSENMFVKNLMVSKFICWCRKNWSIDIQI